MSTDTSGPTQPSVPSSLLWAHILQRPRPPIAPPPRADLTPADKAKATTRILLHDTQSRLETLAKTAEGLLNETKRARVEVERVREECAGAGEKVADEVVGAVNRAQGVIIKVVGEPAQAKDVDMLAANVAGLGKLVDAQMHILTAIQSSIGAIAEQHARAQDRHAQTLATLAPLLALPAAIDALSLRLDRVSPIHSSSPRSTTSSDPCSSSADANSTSSPKRAHNLVEPPFLGPAKRRKLDGALTARTSSNASSTTRRDVDAIFPLPPSAQRPRSRHSSVASIRAHTSTASSTSAHHTTATSSAQARPESGSSSSARAHLGASATAFVHPTPAMFETPQRNRAQPPNSAIRAPNSAIRPSGSATRAPPSTSLVLSTAKPPRAGSFLAPSSPPQARASSPLAHAVQQAPTSLGPSSSIAPQRKTLPTTRITPRRGLMGPGVQPALHPPPRQLTTKAPSPSLGLQHTTSSPHPTTTSHEHAHTSAAPNTSDHEMQTGPATSSNPSILVEGEEEEPLMLIGSPVRPQDGRRWIDVGDSEDEDEG